MIRFDIASAVPVLAFSIRKKVIIERKSTRVFMEPIKIKNCFLVIFVIEEIAAASEFDSPGRNAQRQEEGIERRRGLMIFLLFISFISVLCFGIFIFSKIDIIREEEPNKPERRTKSGCFSGRFIVSIPRIPAKRKRIIAGSFSSSLKIKNIQTQTRINGMNLSNIG